MTQKNETFDFDAHPIDRVYVNWANTLDSTGQDSTAAVGRMEDAQILKAMSGIMQSAIAAGDFSDHLKKFIFYGKTISLPVDHEEVWDDMLDQYLTQEQLISARMLIRNHNTVRLYHAILGLCTETAELMSAFHAYVYEGVPLDWANIAEECGDLCWYMALMAKAQNYTSFDEFMAGNKAKLTARYGSAWTQDGALNRDTENEMKELEVAAPVQTHEVTFDDFASFASLSEIVAQLELVRYKDTIGHKLENNAAFMSLKAMADGKKPVVDSKACKLTLVGPDSFTFKTSARNDWGHPTERISIDMDQPSDGPIVTAPDGTAQTLGDWLMGENESEWEDRKSKLQGQILEDPSEFLKEIQGEFVDCPEDRIEEIDRAIEVLMLLRNELRGQMATPVPPPHKYPPVSRERKEMILNKYQTLESIVAQLSACQYTSIGGRLENNEAFIALRLKSQFWGTDESKIKDPREPSL